MIAKSDLFILVVSASLLGAGIYRWQNNISLMASNAQTAPIEQRVSPTQNTVVSAITNNNVTRTTVTAVTGVQTSSSLSSDQPVVTQVTNSASDTIGSAVNSVPLDLTQPAEPLYGKYTVVSGDYLSKIAQEYDTTVQELQDINNISGTLIEVGQILQYPILLPAN